MAANTITQKEDQIRRRLSYNRYKRMYSLIESTREPRLIRNVLNQLHLEINAMQGYGSQKAASLAEESLQQFFQDHNL